MVERIDQHSSPHNGLSTEIEVTILIVSLNKVCGDIASWRYDRGMRSAYIIILLIGAIFSHWTSAYEETDLQRLLEQNACPGCDLSGADLSRRSLQHADLRAANLTSVRLTQANLHRANLANARLVAAHMTGVDLSFANLSGADLSSAFLRGNVYLIGFYDERPDLRSADLRGTNFSSASFYNVRLEGALMDDATIMPSGFPKPQQVSSPFLPLTTIVIDTSCPAGTRQTYKGCEPDS
jgi:hypothetical protein